MIPIPRPTAPLARWRRRSAASNQLRHVLATQTVWMAKPKAMRIIIDGALPVGVTPKDVILTIISKIGVGGAVGHAVEYAGSTIGALSMEGRMTICNMSVEAGAKIGMIAPDDTTYQYMAGRLKSPTGGDWDRAVAYWKSLPSDEGAVFNRELHLDANTLAPMVSWGTSPEDCSPIDGIVPDPDTIADPDRRRHVIRALDYLDLKPACRSRISASIASSSVPAPIAGWRTCAVPRPCCAAASRRCPESFRPVRAT